MDVQIIQEWKQNSKTKLKDKAYTNINARALELQNSVNSSIQCITNNQSITKFTISATLITRALNLIYHELDNWKGVSIKEVKADNKPKVWKQYHVRADNWWNTNKAKWFGDYFFAPIIQKELKQYIQHVTKIFYEPNHVKNTVNYIQKLNNNHSRNNETIITHDLLYFSAIDGIMKGEVKFHRTKRQRLVPDQSFKLSKGLKNLLVKLGNEHGVELRINRGNDALCIRKCVQQWVMDIITKKQLVWMEMREKCKKERNYDDIKKNHNKSHSFIMTPAPCMESIENCNGDLDEIKSNDTNDNDINDFMKLCNNIDKPDISLLSGSTPFISSISSIPSIPQIPQIPNNYNGFHGTSNHFSNHNNNTSDLHQRYQYRYHPYNSVAKYNMLSSNIRSNNVHNGCNGIGNHNNNNMATYGGDSNNDNNLFLMQCLIQIIMGNSSSNNNECNYGGSNICGYNNNVSDPIKQEQEDIDCIKQEIVGNDNGDNIKCESINSLSSYD